MYDYRPDGGTLLNLLNLPAFNIVQVKETDDAYWITIDNEKEPAHCPQCGTVEAKLQKFGRKAQNLWDTPMHGKRVLLVWHRQRYRCLECSATFLERRDDVFSDGHRATQRVIEYIERKALKGTFVSVADEIGMDESVVRDIFGEYMKRKEQEARFTTPRILGIDEIYMMGKARLVLTNIEHRTLIDILPARNIDLVKAYLDGLEMKEWVEVVTMDMWPAYRTAVHQKLPRATVVVDKFHVVRMANYCLDVVRKNLRSQLTPKVRRKLLRDRFVLLKRRHDLSNFELNLLDQWSDQFPHLRVAYEVKEGFYECWDADSPQDAAQRFTAWEASIPDDMRAAFKSLLTASTNWRGEILAYFQFRVTNAFTESMNNLTRVVNRAGRGYSFDVLRAKLLYAEKAHRRITASKDYNPGEMKFTAPDPDNQRVFNMGAHIDTLVDLLERGEL